MIIPFFIPHAGCPHQCVFCDQKRITGRHSLPDPLTVPPTIETYLRMRSPDGPARVAFYGGSFTALPVEDQERYLAAVQPFLDKGSVGSIRLSTRPDAITLDILSLLKSFRVTTVELGAQSMDDEVLRLSGRGHAAGDTVKAFTLLREQGFTIGIQLMPGLPGDTYKTFQDSVRSVILLGPDIVRIYPTLVIDGTPLAGLYRFGRYTPLSLEDAVDWCRDAMDLFEAAGIAVVRAGLQPTEELGRTGTIIAGPWHPAFRQLIESKRFRDTMERLAAPGAGRPVTVLVHPADLSNAIGQNRSNVLALADRGLAVKIMTDASVLRGSVRAALACTREAHEL